MAKAKPVPICELDGCNKTCYPMFDRNSPRWDRFCRAHRTKATISRFLSQIYCRMSQRVKGRSTKRPDLYKGLSILPKDVFMNWAKNHSEFLSLYKRWFSNDFNRKLTPTVNRMNSSKGYILGNIEWMTNSQNCGLSATVRKMNQKKAVYDLLGVNK